MSLQSTLKAMIKRSMGKGLAVKRKSTRAKRGGGVSALAAYREVLDEVRAKHPNMAYRDAQAKASKIYSKQHKSNVKLSKKEKVVKTKVVQKKEKDRKSGGILLGGAKKSLLAKLVKLLK